MFLKTQFYLNVENIVFITSKIGMFHIIDE